VLPRTEELIQRTFASLAFEAGGGDHLGLERIRILTGSLIAGVAGYLVLRLQLRPR